MLCNVCSAQTVSPSQEGKGRKSTRHCGDTMVTMAQSFMLDEVPEKRKSNLRRAFTLSQFLEKWWAATAFELVDLFVSVYHAGEKQFRRCPPVDAVFFASHIMAWSAQYCITWNGGREGRVCRGVGVPHTFCSCFSVFYFWSLCLFCPCPSLSSLAHFQVCMAVGSDAVWTRLAFIVWKKLKSYRFAIWYRGEWIITTFHFRLSNSF